MDLKITLTVEADEELTDPDDIADAFVGETVDVGVYSATVIRVVSTEKIENAYKSE